MAWMQQSGSGHEGHGAAVAGAPRPADDQAAYEAMGMASPEELDALSQASGDEANCLFLGLMIRHHEGAISMVDAILQLGHDPDVVQTAGAMAQTQQTEIDAMRSIQTRLDCPPALVE